MNFIHHSAFRFHGSLKSVRCLVDKYFTLRIAKVGFKLLKESVVSNIPDGVVLDKDNVDVWTAPEVASGEVVGTAQADIFAVGVVLQEIFQRHPYSRFTKTLAEGMAEKNSFLNFVVT